MEILEAIHGRRSIRAYRPDAVDRALIEELLWAAVQAPSPPASGETPWALCVIEGVDRLASYGDRAGKFAREHRVDGLPAGWTERSGFKVFWGAPALVLICARDGNDETPFDCCRAGQNLMLAAHARGLGSCWVGAAIPWLRSAGVAQELGLPGGFSPVVATILGYPAESPMGSPRPKPDVTWCQPHAESES